MYLLLFIPLLILNIHIGLFTEISLGRSNYKSVLVTSQCCQAVRDAAHISLILTMNYFINIFTKFLSPFQILINHGWFFLQIWK